jgi:glycosyltransferase involved in cell wall biosynthesis
MAPLVSVIVLTKDEEKNLPHLLESLEGLDHELFVVDSGSTDRTVEIAEAAGATVLFHPFESQARSLNWALENLPLRARWTMRLDADERLTPELVVELNAILPQHAPDVTGLLVKRRVYFWGRWIRWGGYYPTWLLRIWRTGAATCEDRWMDEHMVLHDGRAEKLQNDIIDENHKGLGFWTAKHNAYADREVRDILANDARDSVAQVIDQARGRRRMKAGLYLRSPLFLRALAYWFYRYIFRFGFLDGLPGLVFHLLQGFWYRFLVDAKLYELRLREAGRTGL